MKIHAEQSGSLVFHDSAVSMFESILIFRDGIILRNLIPKSRK